MSCASTFRRTTRPAFFFDTRPSQMNAGRVGRSFYPPTWNIWTRLRGRMVSAERCSE